MSKLIRAGLAIVGASACALATVLAVPAFAVPSDPACQELPGRTCKTPPAALRLCPPGYKPADEQPSPLGTLCVIVGQDNANNLHAIAKLSPLLCAHVAVGNNVGRPEDLVRTLHCPVYEPPKTEPVEEPTEEQPMTPVILTPVKQAPTPRTVVSDLPVTH
jgi:hypothetical protein